MFPDTNIKWCGLPSSIDGIEGPILELVRGDSYAIRCLVSQWVNGECARVSTIEFGDPAAFFSVEEMVYSMAYANRENGGTYDGAIYLKETSQSALKAAVEAADYDHRSVRHFLLVGLSICMEVVASDDPEIKDHPSYDAAIAWVQREAK